MSFFYFNYLLSEYTLIFNIFYFVSIVNENLEEKVPLILNELSGIKEKNKYLLKIIFDLLHTAYQKFEKINQSFGLAKMVDSCICLNNLETFPVVKFADSQKYPILTHIIEQWGRTIQFDGKKFEIKSEIMY